MTKERDIQPLVLLAASKAGYTLWRNNTGMGWQGDVVHLPDGSILIRNPRPLYAGLCDGSSDLIGLKKVTIGPDDVGRTIAQFVAFEVKTQTGRVSEDQERFLMVVDRAGGLAKVVRKPEDVE